MLNHLVHLILSILLLSAIYSSAPDEFEVSVLTEETVYKFEPPENGAGPMWAHGNTCIVRYGDKVIASGMETLPGVKPLHNTRWMLYERDKNGWNLILKDPKDRTREPSPLGITDDGKLYLSVNPTLTEPDTYNGPAEPRILQFDANNIKNPYKIIKPVWDGEPEFTEHSYRSFAVDGPRGELILFQNIGYTHAEWAFMDAGGNWPAQGRLVWPKDADYQEHDGAIRVCYPAVQLKDRQVHFLGVSDIMEPNPEWRAYKYKITGRKWDYDFRRLFYTWTPDITKGQFNQWIEIASREETAGHIFPMDLWVGPDGEVHALWTERALDDRMKENFFPDVKQEESLNYAVINNGRVILKKAVMKGEPDKDVVPGRGRFHVTPGGRLFIFYYVHGGEHDIKENRIVEVLPGHEFSASVTVPLQRPLSNFYSSTVRGGTMPSRFLDILGQDDKNEMRYVGIELDLH